MTLRYVTIKKITCNDFIIPYHTSVPTFLLGIGYDMGIYTQYPYPKYPTRMDTYPIRMYAVKPGLFELIKFLLFLLSNQIFVRQSFCVFSLDKSTKTFSSKVDHQIVGLALGETVRMISSTVCLFREWASLLQNGF